MLQMDLSTPVAPATQGISTAPRHTFEIIDHDSASRGLLEARIRSGFGTHFDACISGFMPRFALYRHASGASGIIGIRRASQEPLFLENYLSAPVDAIIAAATGTSVAREHIAEVGQFVVDDRDIVSSFFRDLVPFLVADGFDWVCFTGTDRIRTLLARIGFHGLQIARADEARVRGSADRWGRYYDHDPVVIAGKLSDPLGRWCTDPQATAVGF